METVKVQDVKVQDVMETLLGSESFNVLSIEERMRLVRYMTSRVNGIMTPQVYTKICAWCGRVENDYGKWVEDTRYGLEGEAVLTHGMCPECYEAQTNELRAYVAGVARG